MSRPVRTSPGQPALCRCKCHTTRGIRHVAPCCCVHRFIRNCPKCKREEPTQGTVRKEQCAGTGRHSATTPVQKSRTADWVWKIGTCSHCGRRIKVNPNTNLIVHHVASPRLHAQYIKLENHIWCTGHVTFHQMTRSEAGTAYYINPMTGAQCDMDKNKFYQPLFRQGYKTIND